MPPRRGELPQQLQIIFRDIEQQDKYNQLSEKELGDTRFVDPNVIRILGIEQEVNTLLRNIGWHNFAYLNLPTYKEILLEFLSSLDFKIRRYGAAGQPENMRFRLLGVDRFMTLDEFCQIYDFDMNGEKRIPNDFNENNFWRDLTGRNQFTPGTAAEKYIRNHAIKYLHRFMSHTIFGRKDSNSRVSKKELYCIYCMVNGIKVNAAYWLLPHFKNMAEITQQSLVGGAIVSALAFHYGFPRYSVPTIPAATVNFGICQTSRLCKKGPGDMYYLLDQRGNLIPHQEQAVEEPQQQQSPQPQGRNYQYGESSSTSQMPQDNICAAIRDMNIRLFEMQTEMQQNHAETNRRLTRVERSLDIPDNSDEEEDEDEDEDESGDDD